MVNIRKMGPVTLMIGLPGSGKTSVAAAITKWGIRHKRDTYSNVPIIGAYKIDIRNELGVYHIPKGSTVIVDEAGLEFDNRDVMSGNNPFKGDKGKKLLEWLKLVRHHLGDNGHIIFLSQSADIDKKIRDLASSIWFVRRCAILPHCSIFIRIKRAIDISQDKTGICDLFDKPSILGILFSPRLFRPRVYKMFDSYDAPKLPDHDFDKWESTNKEA